MDEDLIVPLEGVDTERMLEFWRWRIPETLTPWFATTLGDLFLQDADGAVWWLDVGTGELKAVAVDAHEFQERLLDPQRVNFWFGPGLVEVLRASGLVLKPGECYSYWRLPILGGEYRPENFRVYDVVTHFRVWGPLHEKIKDLPDGAQIRLVVE